MQICKYGTRDTMFNGIYLNFNIYYYRVNRGWWKTSLETWITQDCWAQFLIAINQMTINIVKTLDLHILMGNNKETVYLYGIC